MERPDSSSSDEEDDRHNLIEQNERKLPNPNRSTFHIDDDDVDRHHHSNHREFQSQLRRRFGSLNSLNKRYMFAVFLPLVIVVLYFSIDVRNLFSTNLSGIRFDSFSDRLRESELRALYLLRKQQLDFFSLWNHSFNDSSSPVASNSSSNNSSSSDSGSAFGTQQNLFIEDLKFALLRQISLNKEIQQVLLSPHRSANSSSTGLESDSGDPSLGGYGLNRCGKVDQKLSLRKTIEWKPNSNKYLFAICLSGQMSNHLICLEKHMFLAALLSRVLVIPSSKFDYSYSRVLDIVHINKCLGRKAVITFEEFAEIKKNNIHINRFICYFSLPRPCYVDDEHIKKLKGLGITMGKLESAWVEDVTKPNKRTVQDFQAKFSTNDDVIAIGDVFFADVEKEWVMQPGGPLAHKCNTLIEPSRLIILTAQRFIQTFLGKNFVALHFRRHGFLKFCNAKQPSCFFPIPQAADCITRVVERANTPVIYLSTDAADSETSLLQSLVLLNGKTVPLVRRPARNSAEKWDALLYRHGLEGDSQWGLCSNDSSDGTDGKGIAVGGSDSDATKTKVEAMLDKTICAMSSVFIGAPGSTFTEDILRLRKDWGSASVCDEYLCQGEVPNFIADNE
ncbi:O-fucosyltransferase family protein [Parasponia andersonii]|uniref:O-fucosyltransferase family protein n=1 Tax=Parasponia andersonii TaxID=3476 RepID=A0A2P5C9G1_PARAD|nr:O-fucosyltransferase family protein [Parasponia andersonii]